MSDLVERIKKRIEKERAYDETAWETLADKGNREHQVVHSSRNSLYGVILKAIDEESAKEQHEYDSDLISRKKLIRELFYSSNGSKYPTRDCDNFLITISLEDLRKVIYNQPQVQPIVRSVEEIEKIVEAIYINMDCDDCPNRKKCSKIGANISCKDYWTAYLTGKEV